MPSAAPSAVTLPHLVASLLCTAVLARGQIFGDGTPDLDVPSAPAATDSSCQVTLNEVVRQGLDDESDWIEFKGCPGQDLDLEGWRVVDGSDNEFVFGDTGCSQIVPADGYLVLSRDEECSFEFGIGEGESLTLYDDSGLQVDSVTLEEGAAPQGKSYARIPEGGVTWITNEPSKNAANGNGPQYPDRAAASPDLVTVVINELSPSQVAADEDAADWVELYNWGSVDVDLSGLRLSDQNEAPDVGFYFGATGCDDIIPATSYAVYKADDQCSFNFGLGKSDVVTLWFDEFKKIDSVRMGPDNGLATVPALTTWCRVPDSSGVFTVCTPTEGAKNPDEALPEDEVTSLVAEERAAEQDDEDESADDSTSG